MAKSNIRLELTWIGKENRPKLEPRILVEELGKSHHAAHRVSENDLFDNRLIFGDNLLALKALEQEFTGKIKCVYIDPPYNTGSAFTHYDDGVEHSIWLSLLTARIQSLRQLLAPDGSIFVQIDDNECHYLKVLMDEVFGRRNFITSFVWQKVDSPNDNKVPITPDHEYILCYARDVEKVKFRQKADSSLLEAYRGPDEQGRMYRDRLLKKNGKNSLRQDRPSMFFAVTAPDGTAVYPIHDDGREACWALGKTNVDRLATIGELIWKNRGTDGEPRWIPYTREFASQTPTRPFPTIWMDVLTSRQAKAHQKELLPTAEQFATPKPEQLIERILALATDAGDWVLDSFAGSGTTGAVAHKMCRRWLMVELGEHCHTHIIPRLKKVIDGEDQGGITEAVDWKGGGGFRYYKLGPSLIVKDEWENPVINPEFNAGMLAEAMCKLEGFSFDPNPEVYWQQGRSSEADFIYVTTQMMTKEMLTKLSDEVGPNRSLLICCGAYRADVTQFENLTVRKIPKAVLKKCEWGHDDYSLEIKNLPVRVEQEDANRQDAKSAKEEKRPARRFGKGKTVNEGPTLFDFGGLK